MSGRSAAATAPLGGHLWLVVPFLAGFLLAIAGTYWDDGWHTQEGRDSFFIPPHVTLYAGIALAGAVLSLWGLLAIRRDGLRQALGHGPLVLALAGVGVTLAGGPIDDAWHRAWGRDAVVWSPPHMLGVAGTLAISAAMLLELGRSRAGLRGPWTSVAAAAVLAAAAVPVLEYETDVPQFDEAFYLPVLATGSMFAFALARGASKTAWPATLASLIYTGIMSAVALALSASGFPAPTVPLLIIPALVFDVVGKRRLPALGQAALTTIALFVSYVPYLNWIGSGVQLDLADMAIGFPLAFIGSLAALTLVSPPGSDRRPGIHRGAAVATSTGLALLLGTSVAFAHDPGQGTEITSARLTASTEGFDTAFAANLVGGHCDDTEAVALTARRAGEVATGPLREVAPCRFEGTIRLPERGRWFVYAELRHDGTDVEAWLPVTAGENETRVEPERSVYAPTDVSGPVIKTIAGAAMYLIVLAVLISVATLYRRELGRDLGHRTD